MVDALRGTVRTLVEHVFGKYPALSSRMAGVAEELVDEVSAKCEAVMERLLTYESVRPHTLNASFMRSVNNQRKSFLEKLLGRTAEAAPDDDDAAGDTTSDTDGTDTEDKKRAVGDLGRLLESPREILNALRAFWEVSSIRFVDNVALAVRHEVLEGGYGRVKVAFYGALAAPELPSLFAEDGRLSDRRVALEAKRKRLRSAQTAMRKPM